MNYIFTKTAIGYSHIAAGKRCQDFSASYSDEEHSIITACDGHGGDVYVRSHLGAKFASHAVIDVLRELERASLFKSRKDTICESIRLNVLCKWNELVDTHLAKHPIRQSELSGLDSSLIASLRRSPVKAYGTTLNAAMILGTKLITVSIGDGGCMLVKGGVVTPAFEEDEDEPVANVTYSLCQDDAFSHLQVAVHELSLYDGAVVCTDGMINPYQSLANFSQSLVAPAVANLYIGKAEQLAGFVSEVGSHLGTGDDVSLGILVKGRVSVRAYSKAKTI